MWPRPRLAISFATPAECDLDGWSIRSDGANEGAAMEQWKVGSVAITKVEETGLLSLWLTAVVSHQAAVTV